MGIYVPPRRYLSTFRKVRYTGKDLPFRAGLKEQAWYTLASWIDAEFGPGGGSPEEVYQRVTGPRGLTAETTRELLQAADRGGYIESTVDKEES